MNQHIYRVAIFLTLAITIFTLGRYSAYGDAQRIPMSPDQILVGIGMVKAVTEELNRSMDRLVDIGERRAIGQLTLSRAKGMIKTERDTQLNRVSVVVAVSLRQTAQVSNIFTGPTDQLSEDMLNLIRIGSDQISSPVQPVPELMILSSTQRGKHTVRRGAPKDICNDPQHHHITISPHHHLI
ncbi:MAG TPA: hypothetical protein DIT99_08435 [Candidatus Latescibacteria bacterium]|nr:hypothetical protein [Candidatus Latescibacterota bacterium]